MIVLANGAREAAGDKHVHVMGGADVIRAEDHDMALDPQVDREEALVARGAVPQRPLWASTSTKNPAAGARNWKMPRRRSGRGGRRVLPLRCSDVG